MVDDGPPDPLSGNRESAGGLHDSSVRDDDDDYIDFVLSDVSPHVPSSAARSPGFDPPPSRMPEVPRPSHFPH